MKHVKEKFRAKSLGLLPRVIESVLKRRIFFKGLQKSHPVNSIEWHWCEQRFKTWHTTSLQKMTYV